MLVRHCSVRHQPTEQLTPLTVEALDRFAAAQARTIKPML
jgi:hypothetical protein